MAKVANCIDNTNFNYTNFDHHLALSVATYSCKEDRKLCAPSRSSWEGLSASCSAACSSFGPGHGSLSDKLRCQGDWEDDRSTVCDWEDDNLSLFDEELAEVEAAEVEATNQELTADPTIVENDPAEVEPTSQVFIASPTIFEKDPAEVEPTRFDPWAELVDDEDADFGFVIGKLEPEVSFAVPAGPTARWADISDSDEESTPGRSSSSASTTSKELPKAPESQAVQSSRGSRRTRAASHCVAADDSCTVTATEKAAIKESTTTGKRSGAVKTAPSSRAVGSDESKPSHAKGAHKAAGKGSSKGAPSQANKGAEKGASKGVGKGDGKSAGKGVVQNAGKGKGKGKGASKFSGKGASKGSGKGNEKFQCQIIVGIEEDSKFRVVRRLIGSAGANMKDINERSGAKLRLRGRGSKFLEGDEQKESTDDLMLCLSTQDKEGYETAIRMASELLEGIHRSYRAFCAKVGKECPHLALQLHEGYRFGSR